MIGSRLGFGNNQVLWLTRWRLDAVALIRKNLRSYSFKSERHLVHRHFRSLMNSAQSSVTEAMALASQTASGKILALQLAQ